ncbi:MAG: hypothetical protein AMJ54_06075 [Deltaproteobacteria bacterium SG8_13]|nr:MAG: hypothetical protein AMJ54_06075 [Deltaproteobacteria bacterium SG8_13]
MKISEVPQQPGMITDGRREICYAVDDDGNYVLAGSAGWEPKNIANDQAWEIIRDQMQDTVRKIRSGKLSPLAFLMVSNQMTPALLAQYVGFSRWRVRRHLKPSVFKKLKPEILKRYADLFDVPVDTLSKVPKDIETMLSKTDTP